LKDKKYIIKRANNELKTFYLELCDLSDASIQIWEEDGKKKTFVKIKFSEEELEKIINEYKHIQTL
jgi:hypothetical protein